MRRPNDFPPRVIAEASKRVNGLCSRPECRHPTFGPHTDLTKSTNVGEAAHIEAAGANGPRANPQMMPEECASISNAIWLCVRCARLIDKDPDRFPVELLRGWKIQAEAASRAGLEFPSAAPTKRKRTPQERARAYSIRTRELAQYLIALGDSDGALLEISALAERAADGDLDAVKGLVRRAPELKAKSVIDLARIKAEAYTEDRGIARIGAELEKNSAELRAGISAAIAHHDQIAAFVDGVPSDHPDRAAALALLRLAEESARKAHTTLAALDERERVSRERDAERAAIRALIDAAADKPLLVQARALVEARERLGALRQAWKAEDRRQVSLAQPEARALAAGLSPAQLRKIDELCEAMDKEHIPAGMWFPPGEEAYPQGGTILDACRDAWIERTRQGLPLPEHWWSDSKSGDYNAKLVQKRLQEHGTREWRKAYPWMMDDVSAA